MPPLDRPIGSLLDLLPRRGDVEYNALPKFIRDEIDILRKGGRPVAPGDLQEVIRIVVELPAHIAALGTEQRVQSAEIRDALKAQTAALAEQAKAMTALQKEQAASRTWLIDHEKRLDAHDVQNGVHAKKLVEHAEQITGIHQRVTAVEQVLTKSSPKKRPNKSAPKKRPRGKTKR